MLKLINIFPLEIRIKNNILQRENFIFAYRYMQQ